jgi:uncharacterized protein (TIGR03435 family)
LLRYTPSRDGVGAAADPAADLLTAVREQLGLKLEPRKEPVEMLRERAERIPTEN